MPIHMSGEDYLEAILILKQEKPHVRAVDLARHMGFSKPSISHAVTTLRSGGFLDIDSDGFLVLTEPGRELAEKVYERHLYFQQLLLDSGVEPEIAREDACKMEHAISDESYRHLRAMLDKASGQMPEDSL